MFDLRNTDGSVRKIAFKSPIPGNDVSAEGGARVANVHRLDKPEMIDLHGKFLGHYVREIDKQAPNRHEQAEEEDFYDNIQWSPEDAAVLEERGQKPIVYNVVSTAIDWVTGSERRSRKDFKVLPRRKGDAKPAQKKTELMKYLSDVNKSQFHVSRAFTDAVKVGLGWMEDGIGDSDDEEPLYSRYEDWRNILHDSNATELDLSDARYLFRSKWFDVDIAAAMFKERYAPIEAGAMAAENYVALDNYADEAMDSQENLLERSVRASIEQRISGAERRRVRVIEAWFRKPVEVRKIKGGVFHGEFFDPSSRGHHDSLAAGEGRIIQKVAMRMHVAIFTVAGMLWFSESPYRHNQFPFTPVWGKRRRRDGLPYGMIRGIKDIQDDVNKRASKAQWILAQNRIIMEDGAVDDVDELVEEAARADAVLIRKAGKELKFDNDRDLSQYQLELMSKNISMIQATSGVTDELLGRETQAKSGKAIIARQEQGSMATALYFDNLRLAMQLRGEKVLANIEQFMEEPKQFRITNQRGRPEYPEVNDGLPENDIVRSKADFIIDEADWKATMRQAAVEQLMGIVERVSPEVALVLIDLAVENMDLPNGEEVVKRIRALTGMRDPDADELTPEEEEALAAKQQDTEVRIRTALALLRKAEGDARTAEAKASQIEAQTAGTNVDSQNKALTAAATAMTMPSPAVHAADHILQQSGWKPGQPIQPVGLGMNPPPMQMPPPAAAAPTPAPAL